MDSCWQKIEHFFFTGTATSLSILNFITCIHSYTKAKNSRKAALIGASFCAVFMSILASMSGNYLDLSPTAIKLIIANLPFTYGTHAFLVSATFDRYFILYFERIRRKMQMGTKLFTYGIIMFVYADGCNLFTGKVTLQRTIFWGQLIFLVPLFHMIFGVISYLKTVRASQTPFTAIISTQPIITLSIILLWIIWFVTIITGRMTGGSTVFLLALAAYLESSIGSITHTVQTIFEPSLSGNSNSKATYR